MKKLFSLIAVVLITVSAFAQAPEKMSYQAVIRNAADELVRNQNIGMRISILQSSATGTAVYVETHSTATNENGLLVLEVGAGTSVNGTFSAINWGNDSYYLKIETDVTGGTNYTIAGSSQLISVSYALHAKNAATVNNLTVEKSVPANADFTDDQTAADVGITAITDLSSDNVQTALQALQEQITALTQNIGCTDKTACNYNTASTISGLCIYADGISKKCSGESDGTGTVVDNDTGVDPAGDAGTNEGDIGGGDPGTGGNTDDNSGGDTGTGGNTDGNSGVDVGANDGNNNGAVDPSGDGCVDESDPDFDPFAEPVNGPCDTAVPKIGDEKEGGLVFYVDEVNKKAYVVAKENVGQYHQWGCSGTEISGADGTVIGTGQKNTLDIISGCSETNIAAKACADYSITVDGKTYEDWFLPSKDELAKIYDNKTTLEAISGFTAFANVEYASSSEDGSSQQWNQNLSTGVVNVYSKLHNPAVRAIRVFSY